MEHNILATTVVVTVERSELGDLFILCIGYKNGVN